ncbi:MAG: metallophosphoesterase [Eubacteriales bacterium]|jgi:predicted phosphodiesterase|nr:metallophosphoesterase [Eubacteriales bacterium]
MLRTGLFADSHYSTQAMTEGTRRPDLSESKLREAVSAFLHNRVSAVICLGDLINGEDSDAVNRANLCVITAPLHELRAEGIRVFCIRGNHDAEVFDEGEFAGLSMLETAPLNVLIEGVRLILLDACFTSAGLRYEKHNIDWTDAYIDEGQLIRLGHQLKESSQNGESVYIFTHQNLDPNVESRHIISNAGQVRGILEEHGCVRGVYQGHYHKGARNIHNGIQYITLPAMCEGIANSFMIADLK